MQFVRLCDLSADLQQRIHTELAERDTPERRDEGYLLSYRDAAIIYGYEYGTIRYYVCKGKLQPVFKGGARYLTHAEMRRFIEHRRGGRRPFGHNAQALAQRTTP